MAKDWFVGDVYEVVRRNYSAFVMLEIGDKIIVKEYFPMEGEVWFLDIRGDLCVEWGVTLQTVVRGPL